jgi:hypothetical protein
MKTWIALGIFALAVALFFSDVLFGSRIFLDTNPYHYEPWAVHGTEQDLASKTYRTDALVTYLPRRVELSQSIRSGRFPLWNPYIFGGMPFFADPQSRVIYPISLLLVPLDPVKAMGWDVAIHFFIAMFGMYLYLRRIGSNGLGSMLGGVTYGFSSFFFLRMGHPTFIATASWIPFFFYSFEVSREKERAGVLLLTVFFSLGYLAGFPQVFLFGVGAVLIYALYLSLSADSESRMRRLLKAAKVFGISAALSLLVVSVQLVPFVEFLRNSTGLGIDYEKMRDVFLANPIVLLRTIFPTLFGTPIEGTDWSRLTRATVHPYNPDFMVYCGIGGLVACLGSLIFLKKSARIKILVALLLLSVGLATNSVLLRAGYVLLPILRISRVARVSVLSCFALSALAGIGLSTVFANRTRRVRRYFSYILASVVLVSITVALIITVKGDAFIAGPFERARDLPEETWLRIHAQNRSIMVREWAKGDGAEWVAYEGRQIRRGLLFVVLTCAIALLYVLPRRMKARTRSLIGLLFFLVVAVDIGTIARSHFISQPRDCLFETDSIRSLKEALWEKGKWRIHPFAYKHEDIRTLPPNTNQLFGLYSIRGTSTIAPDTYMEPFEIDADRLPSELLTLGLPAGAADILWSDQLCGRYILTATSKPPYVIPRIFRVVVAKGGIPSRARMHTIGHETRLALTQRPREGLNLELDTRPVRWLDFAIGFEADVDAPGDSLMFALTWQGEAGQVDFGRAFDLYRDRGTWHPFRLDLSPAIDSAPGITSRAKLRMGMLASNAVASRITGACWSGLELVYEDCRIRETDGAYEIGIADTLGVLSLRLSSKAREIPLEIGLDGDSRRTRWIAFPPDMSMREVFTDVAGNAARRVALRSDSAFALHEAKMVYLGPVYPNYQLISDYDMYVYESTAAVRKGVCIDKNLVHAKESEGPGVVDLSLVHNWAGAECGSCRILSYEPERVSLEVSAERDCYLVFQDTYYKGWKAFVGDEERDLLVTDIGMRAIELKQGRHNITMEFRPASLKIGLAMTCLGLVLTVVYARATRRRNAS